MTATADALMAIFGFKRVEGSEMKTDRELLELAAKAAGISFFVDSHGRGMEMHANLMPCPWNPLTDDGDALRLAEQCSLTVCMDGIGTVSACDERRKDEIFVTQSIHECGGSRITATRRAIVRAAASIAQKEEP